MPPIVCYFFNYLTVKECATAFIRAVADDLVGTLNYLYYSEVFHKLQGKRTHDYAKVNKGFLVIFDKCHKLTGVPSFPSISPGLGHDFCRIDAKRQIGKTFPTCPIK